MKRTLKIRLQDNKEILNTIKTYNSVCNIILKRGFRRRTWNKILLHQDTYSKIRKKYPNLQSSLVCCARDQASNMLKREKCKHLPVKKEYSSIRYNARTITIDLSRGIVSVSTLKGRKKITIVIPSVYEKYKTWKCQSANIGVKNGHLFAFLIVEQDAPAKLNPENMLGIDRGIINPVVCSDNRFFNSREIRRVKSRYQYLKSQLQAKGTPSAKRHLKRLSGKEQRFVKDCNHKIAKEIANSDADTFVLEDLNIKTDKKNGRRFNKLLGNWSHRQFQSFLEYNCEALGKNVIYVNPRHTSQMCSVCGNIEKSNRKGRNFKCGKCEFSLNADLNASRNIAKLGKALFVQADVKQPIVASQDSYKPSISMDGI